ncbi:trypsin-like peptidase domain-containing protein [Candidatus Saccharibacteria bacterium]|nr:trypsin-like peptidase domain-containing protein [Candidatus Saccharibacteria bacterium]
MQENKSEEKTAEPKSSNLKVLTLILAIFAFIFAGASLTISIIDYQNGDTPLTITQAGADGNSANFTEGSIADVANKVSNSVVSITTEIRTTGWFGQSSTSTAAGTGVIISSDGYILTNKHVIEDANKISVVTADGKSYEKVKLVATDPLNDIAFLKISDVANLPSATLGNSKTLAIGQPVIAIGNALGQFDNTVTSGIISGTGRSIVATDSSYSSQETLVDMIQTDAAINAGNSGGPLVNAAGEVIGINTATSSDADGIGFAIPISSVKGMLNQLLETGKAERAYLGVYSITITPEVVSEYDLPVNSGAYLYYESGKYTNSAIAKNSPAEKAGLKNKDIVLSVDGTKIGASGSLTTLIGEYKPGDTVQLSILREGKEMAVNVTLGAYEED